MTLTRHRVAAAGAALVIGTLGLTACGANEAQDGGSSADGGDGGGTIALLLPESKTTRYEAFDKPLFEAEGRRPLRATARSTTTTPTRTPRSSSSRSRAPSARAPRSSCSTRWTATGAGGMVAEAQDSGAQVIAYDRFIEGADYYLSFDNERVGEMQAEALVDAMGGSGDILMLNGAPTDPNAAQFKPGAHNVLDASRREDPRRVRQPRLEPREGPGVHHRPARQARPRQHRRHLRRQRRPGRRRRRRPDRCGRRRQPLPPITGQDAELAAIQRIVAGEQAHDDLQAHPDRGRERRRGRGGAGQRRGGRRRRHA